MANKPEISNFYNLEQGLANEYNHIQKRYNRDVIMVKKTDIWQLLVKMDDKKEKSMLLGILTTIRNSIVQ